MTSLGSVSRPQRCQCNGIITTTQTNTILIPPPHRLSKHCPASIVYDLQSGWGMTYSIVQCHQYFDQTHSPHHDSQAAAAGTTNPTPQETPAINFDDADSAINCTLL
mmetsp:Transcript_27226/g.58352  ORF Transcript_27226/g.58352 Transcript_27226/m.58352 type:complete len:107 (+) Transcript_27226:695-1015(+)